MSNPPGSRRKLLGLATFFFLLGALAWAMQRSVPGWLLFAVLLGIATTWPATLLVSVLFRGTGLEPVSVAGVVVGLLALAVCSLLWAWALTVLPSMSRSARKAWALASLLCVLVSTAPLVCWWSGATACPPGLLRLATYQASFFEDVLYMRNAPKRGLPSGPGMMEPAIAVQVSVAGLVAATTNGFLWAALLGAMVVAGQRVGWRLAPESAVARPLESVAEPVPAPSPQRRPRARLGLWLVVAAAGFVIGFPVAVNVYERQVVSPSAWSGNVEPVESWSRYADIDAFTSAVRIVLGNPANDIRLAFTDAPSITGPEGTTALSIRYRVASPAPDDYVGFVRDLDPPVDWRGWGGVTFFAAIDGELRGPVVFRFREVSGEVWQAVAPLGAAGHGALHFDLRGLEPAPQSPRTNGQVGLGAIDQYGIEIGHAGPGLAGTLLLGQNFLVC